jgi:hypothetical protein
MKEDILEQVVEDYLHAHGYLTMANVKFRPDVRARGYDSRQDSVHSDVDVLGINPNRRGPSRVIVVSCKSWQGGFDPPAEVRAIKKKLIISGRERWRAYRELANAKWAKALKDTVFQLTASRQFTYWTAVTRIKSGRDITVWTENKTFQRNLTPYIQVVTVQQMVARLADDLTTTPADSQLGRLLQVLKASGTVMTSASPSSTTADL